MNTLKKLIVTLLLVCSTSSFANTGGGGFDDPIELFNFYYKLAEKARVYREKHGKYNPEHVKKLAPHSYAENKNYLQGAEISLAQHVSYIWNAQATKHPLKVEMRQLKPYFGRGEKREGILTIPYFYYKHQRKEINGIVDDSRLFQVIAKNVGNKIKWYVY
ncbi:hypothetical protein [Halarcobacter sp.]|uniref:hypothetical protein n=1 Tax=Halarcobacter sp. TaxID=2321133 RepID=UPI003A92EE16